MAASFDGSEELIGRELGGYRLLQVVGRGAAGAVYLAQRTDDVSAWPTIELPDGSRREPPTTAAIKVLMPPPQLSRDDRDEFAARFRREAKVLQNLRHPHILPVLASGEDPRTGHLYMILPFIEGGTLARRLEQARAMPLPEAASYAQQLAEAIDYAHRQGIVHRDIKPANILIDNTGNVYLADFGIVKLFDTARATTLTTGGQVIGTPEYMAPEQARGEEVRAAADIYSLGAVLYHLVTGRPPFLASNLVDLILQLVQTPPLPPQRLRPDLPEPAAAAILAALSKAPAERYASGAELAHAFETGLRGQWSPRPAAAVDQSGIYQTAAAVHPAPTIRAPVEPPNTRHRLRNALGIGMIALIMALSASGVALAHAGLLPIRLSPVAGQNPTASVTTPNSQRTPSSSRTPRPGSTTTTTPTSTSTSSPTGAGNPPPPPPPAPTLPPTTATAPVLLSAQPQPCPGPGTGPGGTGGSPFYPYQTLQVRNTGTVPLTWAGSPDDPNYKMSPSGGTLPAGFLVYVDVGAPVFPWSATMGLSMTWSASSGAGGTVRAIVTQCTTGGTGG